MIFHHSFKRPFISLALAFLCISPLSAIGAEYGPNPNITVKIDPKADAATHTNVVDGIGLAEAYFKRVYRDQVRIDTTVVAYLKIGFQNQNVPSRARYKPCNGGYGGVDGSQKTFVVICLSSQVFTEAARKGPEKLAERQRGLAIHELVHTMQRQWRRGKQYAKGEPYWIREAEANYIAGQMRYGRLNYPMDEAVARWRRNGNLRIPIRNFRSMSGFQKNVPYSYSNTALAAYWLEQYAGKGAFKDYWEATGRGVGWQTAFHQAFGLTPNEFYASFEY